MASVRTFLSFDPPPAIRAEMKALQDQLRRKLSDVGWVRPELFHATITFLGNVDEALFGTLLPELAAITLRHEAIDVAYEGVGVFPNARRPNVLWIGCTTFDNSLLRLKEDLDAAARRHGIDIAPQEFHPHITLGRIRSERAGRDLTPMLETLTFEPRRTRIERISVMKSVLSSHGATYSVLSANPLHERTTNNPS